MEKQARKLAQRTLDSQQTVEVTKLENEVRRLLKDHISYIKNRDVTMQQNRNYVLHQLSGKHV